MADEDLSGTNPASLSLDPIVDEAMKRFQRCAEWEGFARERFLDDIKFANADSDNGYQWPNAIRKLRDNSKKPCLTLNMTRQHNLQIVNDAKKTKSGIRVRAVGNGATVEAAKIWGALIRRIEYLSDAADAYSTAAEFQVDAGIGWWRIITDYVDESSFDQDVFIQRVTDPLSVYIDPDCKQKDKSDAKFGFVFDTIPKDQFADMFPEYKDRVNLSPLGTGSSDSDWITKNHVRIAEYFRVIGKPDKLISFISKDTGLRQSILRNNLPAEAVKELLAEPNTRSRPTERLEVEWKLIVGQQLIDSTLWLGPHIPLVPCIGQETVIDGTLDRKGHTRAMKDAQRMYNYNASAQVEFVALQSKTPWVAAVKAIEENEQYWNSANTENYSVLPYNHVDEDGNKIDMPMRQQPPTASQAYETGMLTAQNQMMMTSGQYQNALGMQGNERTGEAIGRRQDQGETATFHFRDNFAVAIRNTGKQLLALIPLVYDTERVVKIMAEDGTDLEVEISPAAKQAFQVVQNHQQQVIRRIFNPGIGKYEVEADIGASYATRKDQTTQAMTLILTQNPQLTTIIGDLLLASIDFDKAEEASQRLKRMVPPQALGQGPSQNEQMLTQQLQTLKDALVKSLETQAKAQLKVTGQDSLRQIETYRAETDRIKALAPIFGEDQAGVLDLLQQLIRQSHETNLENIKTTAKTTSQVDGANGNEG